MNQSGRFTGAGGPHRPLLAAAALLQDVVLEDVHQLVAEHVVGVLVVAGEGQDHARPQPLGDAAGPLADQPAGSPSSAGSRPGRRRG